MNEKYRYEVLKEIFDKHNNSNGWYEYDHKTKPTKWEIFSYITELIKQDEENIIRILELLPEDDIQEFLRAKKLAKIQKNTK